MDCRGSEVTCYPAVNPFYAGLVDRGNEGILEPLFLRRLLSLTPPTPLLTLSFSPCHGRPGIYIFLPGSFTEQNKFVINSIETDLHTADYKIQKKTHLLGIWAAKLDFPV
ncbi:hypothetical protein FKM82_017183 [Ascaphus truei]